MRRREFITLLGGAIAWPLAVSAQQPAMPVIGFLNSRASGEDPQLLTAFREGLKEAGYVEDHNVVIDYRFAGNQNERLPALAMELVRRQVAVIVANGPAAVPAKAATTSIPVVFVIGFDPVQFGLVASLNRPGGNLTGVINLFDEIGPKRLELVHELVPAATTVGVLLNPSYPTTEIQLRDLQAAARSFGLQLHILHASSDHDFDGAFAKLGQLRAGALVIGNDPFFNSRSEQLGALSASHAVPAIFQTRELGVSIATLR